MVEGVGGRGVNKKAAELDDDEPDEADDSVSLGWR